MSVFATAFEHLASGTALLAQQDNSDWFRALLNSRHFDMVVVFSFVTLVVAIPAVCGIWYKLRVKEWETALKQTMLDRGMSAEEIRSVLDAGSRMTVGGCRSKNHDFASTGSPRSFS